MGYFDQLCRLLNTEGNNFAICGSEFREEFLPEGEIPICDRVIVCFGTNDFHYREKSEFEEKMPLFFQTLFEQVREKPVYVILPFWREEENEIFQMGITLDEVRARIEKEVSRFPNAFVINGKYLLPNARVFTFEGVHPNALGGTHIAIGLFEKIKSFE